MSLARAVTKIRQVPPLRFRRFRPVWDRFTDRDPDGDLASVNGDRLRVTYRYGVQCGHEPAVHCAFTSQIRAEEVVFDIGPRLGLISLGAAIRGARVFAFEPAPAEWAILKRHVRMNQVETRVSIVARAVTDRVGFAPLVIQDTRSDGLVRERAGRSSSERLLPQHQETWVPTTTIDAFSAERRVDSNRIAVDVGGAAAAVLRGGRRALEGPTVFLVHVDPSGLHDMGSSPAELECCLSTCGRSLRRVTPPNARGTYYVLSTPA